MNSTILQIVSGVASSFAVRLRNGESIENVIGATDVAVSLRQSIDSESAIITFSQSDGNATLNVSEAKITCTIAADDDIPIGRYVAQAAFLDSSGSWKFSELFRVIVNKPIAAVP